MLDDDRSMLTLTNAWASKATCMQRRGRCGRLQDGVIIYLFSRDKGRQKPNLPPLFLLQILPPYSDTIFDRVMKEYADPEVANVPLETIYLKAKVLLETVMGSPPERLLSELMDPPPMENSPAVMGGR